MFSQILPTTVVPKEKYGEPLGEHTCQYWGLKGLRGPGKSCLGPLSLSWTSCLLYREVEGDRGQETGRKGGGRCTGGGRRGGGKWDSQGRGKREKKGKITQHCAILRNLKNAKRREPKNTGAGTGIKGYGKREV